MTSELYDEATATFNSIKGYKDSGEKARESQYQKGIAYLTTNSFDEAISVFKGLGDYSDSSEQVLECKYQKARYFYDNNQKLQAYWVYKGIQGYKDVDDIISRDTALLSAVKTFKNSMEVGNKLYFGSYEQDGVETDGTEPLQWGVIARDGNTVELISIYVLDDVQRGSVQKWLSDFKNNAFSEEEQSVLKGSPTLLERQRVIYIGAASPTKASSNKFGDYWCLGLGYFVTAKGNATQENVKFDTVVHGIRPVIIIDIGAL